MKEKIGYSIDDRRAIESWIETYAYARSQHVYDVLNEVIEELEKENSRLENVNARLTRQHEKDIRKIQSLNSKIADMKEKIAAGGAYNENDALKYRDLAKKFKKERDYYKNEYLRSKNGGKK